MRELFSLQTVSAVGAVLVLLLVSQWDSICQMGMREDLRQIGVEVRKADISYDSKEKLLDQIDLLDKRLRNGESIGMIDWTRYTDSVTEMLEHGIVDDEDRLIHRELVRIGELLDEE